MAQLKVHGAVESFKAVGRDFDIVNVAVDGTNAVELEKVVLEMQAANISITAIGELAVAGVNFMIEGHAAVPATVAGYVVATVAF